MSKIAIIDDNAAHAETLQKSMNIHLQALGSDLNCIVQFPFKNIEQFFSFIENEDVCLIILDERLNDQKTPEGGPVDYKGNELIVTLRERLKDFPIYMVTTHTGDPDLQAKRNEFEDLINRDDLTVDIDTAKSLVAKIVRAAQRYLNSTAKELTEFNDLTIKVAGGNGSAEDIERLKALQIKLELPFSGFDDRKGWLDAYEKEIKELEILKGEILKKLENK